MKKVIINNTKNIFIMNNKKRELDKQKELEYKNIKVYREFTQKNSKSMK